MRTARIQLKEHPTYLVTAFYPFPYKCIHSRFSVSVNSADMSKMKFLLQFFFFVVHKKSTTSHVGKYCMNLPKSLLELVLKIFCTAYVLRVCLLLLHCVYRVIHKSLRDFRTRLRNNQDRHGRKEHINR